MYSVTSEVPLQGHELSSLLLIQHGTLPIPQVVTARRFVLQPAFCADRQPLPRFPVAEPATGLVQLIVVLAASRLLVPLSLLVVEEPTAVQFAPSLGSSAAPTLTASLRLRGSAEATVGARCRTVPHQ